jgi:hypothetical protein
VTRKGFIVVLVLVVVLPPSRSAGCGARLACEADLSIRRKLRRTGLRRAQSSRCRRIRPRGVMWTMTWSRFCGQHSFLSRRDYRTQPGVLTPGTCPKMPALKGRKIGVIDSTLRSLFPGRAFVLRPFRAARLFSSHLGLRPQAESLSPFGTKAPDTCLQFRLHITPNPLFEDSDSTELAEVLSAVAFALCSRSASQARRAPQQALREGGRTTTSTRTKRPCAHTPPSS